MPSDVGLKIMNSVHRVLLKVGVGKSLLKMPVLELTTIGRKSGQPRSVMLTAPVVEGSTYVIVASKGGNDENPAWFLNLRDNPDVQVSLGAPGNPKPYKATIADATERARLWPKITADHDNYAGYQKKTDREIPVVLLNPA